MWVSCATHRLGRVDVAKSFVCYVHNLQKCTALLSPWGPIDTESIWPIIMLARENIPIPLRLNVRKQYFFTIMYRSMKTWFLYYNPVKSNRSSQQFQWQKNIVSSLSIIVRPSLEKISLSITSKYLETLD